MSCIFLLASNFYFSYLSLKTYSLSGFDSYILCLVSNDRSQAGNTKSGIFLEPQESLEASFYFLCFFFFSLLNSKSMAVNYNYTPTVATLLGLTREISTARPIYCICALTN